MALYRHTICLESYEEKILLDLIRLHPKSNVSAIISNLIRHQDQTGYIKHQIRNLSRELDHWVKIKEAREEVREAKQEAMEDVKGVMAE